MPNLDDKKDMLRVVPSVESFKPVSKDEVRNLYFRTMTASQFCQEGAPEDARAENFIDVHGIGQRTGPYLPYQKKRAPLLDYSSVQYFQDYIALPLDDAPITRALAKANKLRSNPQDKSVSMAKFDDRTRYKETFKPPSRKEAQLARQKSAKPKAGRTHTMPTGDLLEKRSFSHDVFGVPNQSFKSEPAKPPKPNLFLSERYAPITTAYRDEFTPPKPPRTPGASPCSTPSGSRVSSKAPSAAGQRKKPKRCTSAPAGGRREKPVESLREKLQRPVSATAKLAAMVCRDEDIYKVRRACFLSPGN
eukprot:gb/GFBE01064419.1/.p1 GENE.gb/GFBE01064419.1/~~gb/GFBE01064419.1/.p1  ORF type:complete len:305 (+),score=55.46 gb/GFBE01064419.1/:1-915(+)